MPPIARTKQTKHVRQQTNKVFISHWIHISVVIFSGRRHRRALQMSRPMTRVFINMYVHNGPKNKKLSPLFFLSCPSGPLITHNPFPQTSSECAECFKQVHLFCFSIQKYDGQMHALKDQTEMFLRVPSGILLVSLFN